MSDGCGPKCSASCKLHDPVGYSWRMFLASVLADSTKSLTTWSPLATAAGRLLWKLDAWGHHIDVHESSLWATPTARDHKDTPGMWILDYRKDGGTRIDQLHRQIYLDGLLNEASLENLGSLNVSSFVVNPEWVEELMGFPRGWTDLQPSETRSSLKSSNSLDDLL